MSESQMKWAGDLPRMKWHYVVEATGELVADVKQLSTLSSGISYSLTIRPAWRDRLGQKEPTYYLKRKQAQAAAESLVSNMSGSDPERIVAAAVRIGVATLTMPPPKRHHDLVSFAGRVLSRKVGMGHQGFLTSTGRYVDRQEAAQTVLAAGQPLRPQPPGGMVPLDQRGPGAELYSEDLW